MNADIVKYKHVIGDLKKTMSHSWHLDADEILMGEKIGAGGQGQVYKAR